MWLPVLIFGPALGSLADRYPAHWLSGGAMVIRFGAAALLLAAPTVEVFLAAVALRAAGNLGASALPVVVREIVPKKMILDSTRLSISVEQGTPEMAAVLRTSAAFCFVIECVEPLIPLMVSRLLSGVQAYGVIMAMTSAGGLLGAHHASRLSGRFGFPRALQRCLAVGAGVTALMAAVKAFVDVLPAWQIGVYWGLIGVLYGAMLTMLTAAIQHHAPQSRLGVVSSKGAEHPAAGTGVRTPGRRLGRKISRHQHHDGIRRRDRNFLRPDVR